MPNDLRTEFEEFLAWRAGRQDAPVPTLDLSFGELLDKYSTWAGGGGTPTWAAWGKGHVDHLKRILGHLPFRAISYDQADTYVAKRRGEYVSHIKAPTKRRLIADQTIERELATARAAINWAIKRRHIGGPNSLDKYGFEWTKEALARKGARRFHLPEADFLRILDAIPHRMTTLALCFAFETGMRRDEWRSLQEPEIAVTDDGVTVTLAAHRTKARRERRVPLSDAAVALVARARELKRALGLDSSPFVFPSEQRNSYGQAIPKSTLGGRFRIARDAAGVRGPADQDVWIHTLRKSFGTLHALTMPPRLLKEIMGHSSDAVHREYLDLAGAVEREARAYLNERRKRPQSIESTVLKFAAKSDEGTE